MRITRRALGRGAAALLGATTLLAAGCDSEDPVDLPALPSLGEEEPDLEQVAAGLRHEQAVLQQVARVRRRHLALRGPLRPTEAVHQAHVQLLARAVDEPTGEETTQGEPSRRKVPADPRKALADVISLERSLAAQHVGTAMRSRSGVLARVVAAMSAAAAQQAASLASLGASSAVAGRAGSTEGGPLNGAAPGGRPLPALQATLAAEHAAVYVYEVLGGRVSALTDPGTAERLRSAYEAHRARRDHLRAAVADLGEEPVAAAAAYRVDAWTREADELLEVARRTEDRAAGVYAELAARTTGGHRRWAITALTDAAVRRLTFGGSPTSYPGAPELGRRS